jgi:4-hydroxybutyrate CoA-transferase
MKMDLTIDWAEHYGRRLVSPEQAAASVVSGDHIWVPPGHASPAILTALAQRRDELRDVQIRGLGIPDVGLFDLEAQHAFHVQDQFGTIFTRAAHEAKTIDYHPYWLVGAHKALDAGRDGEAWYLDKVMVQVCPPNEQGYVSVGGSVWDSVTAARRAGFVTAAVNPQVVETYGDTWLHVSEIDQFVPEDRPVLPPGLLQTDEFDRADEGIAHYVDTLVSDGDTIQVGTGSHTSGMLHHGLLKEREELSYFGELTVAGLVPLVEQGIITGRTSVLHPGRFVATLVGNNQEEHQTIHRNRAFELHGIEYLLDPRNIAQNEGIVAINGALGVDLSGQAAAYTIGPRIYAGMGGHLAFAMGAFLAPRGRYVCILPSTAVGGTVSTIQGRFEEGQIVSIPREIADTVVTEHGVARLLGKSVRQRADELIAVAHPDFRAELRKQARTYFYPSE